MTVIDQVEVNLYLNEKEVHWLRILAREAIERARAGRGLPDGHSGPTVLRALVDALEEALLVQVLEP
ncbi:MAG: hypothetical protein HY717_15920 [Planctomycetes bacterium]|nr:hypothetical protein [Planctomycetota bacterium]